MTMPSYTTSAPRAYGELAGTQLLTALEAAGHDPFTVAQATGEGANIGLSARHVASLLHRLAASGLVTRLKKGVYALSDPVTRLPRAHTFAIGTALVTPSAISHWSALQHWGLTEQIPSTIMLSSPTRTFPPSGQAEAGSSRKAWVVAGTRYEVVTVTDGRFFGIAHAWVSERNQVAIFDGERALLDAFHHFHVFGSLSVGLDILETHLAELDLVRLARYAEQLQVTAVVKRLGWALERLGASSEVLDPLRVYPARGDAPLDPGQPARGRHNRTWRVIENLHA